MNINQMHQIFWHNHKIAEIDLQNSEMGLWTWFSNFRAFFGSRAAPFYHDDRPFLRYYLNCNLYLSIQFLSVNIILLLLAVYVIALKHIPDNMTITQLDPAFDAFQGAIVQIGIWIALSLLCLAHQLGLLLNPSLFSEFFMSNECDVWYEVGATVMVTRLLSLVLNIMNMTSYEETCMDAADLVGTTDQSFGYMFIAMAMDTFQTFAFAILPFPQPWTIFFSLLELARQELRLWSCAARISSDPGHLWIVRLAGFLLVMVYVTLIIVPSIFLENSVRNRFTRRQLQHGVEVEKREMISFLSTDVRVPLQYMLHSMASLNFVELSGGDATVLMSSITKLSRTVSSVSDDLLLLVRIQEGRYKSKCSLVRDLRALIDETVQARLASQITPTAASRTTFHRTGAIPAVAAAIAAAAASAGAAAARVASSANGMPSIHTLVPADLEVTVDAQCLLAVLRHLLAFAAVRDCDELEDADSDAEDVEVLPLSVSVNNAAFAQLAAAGRLDMTLTARVRSQRCSFSSAQTHEAIAADRSGVPHELTVVLSVNAYARERWSASRRIQEATTAYICNTVAACCGGKFEADQYSYTLTLPCHVASEASAVQGIQSSPSMDTNDLLSQQANDDASAMESIVAPSVSNTAFSLAGNSGLQVRNSIALLASDRAELEERIAQSASMQRRFRKQRICVIAEDEVLSSVVTAVARRLRLEEGMNVLRELQPRELHVPKAKLIFVTSYAVCEQLRQRQYKGRIVLFTGSMSYLDEEQAGCVDFCLPLPCADHHLISFVDWLIEMYQEDVREVADAENLTADRIVLPISRIMPQTLHDVDDSENGADPLYVLSLPARFCLQLLYMAGSSALTYWQHCDTWLLVTRLPPGTLESYYQWRLLNPSRSWYHQSTELLLTVLPRLLLSLVLELNFVQQAPLVTILTIVAISLLLTARPVYHYALKPLGGKLWVFWAFISAFAPLLYGCFTFIAITSAPPLLVHNLTLSAFLKMEFNEYRTGAAYLYAQIMTAAFSRLYGIYNMYPMSIAVVTLLFVRSSQVNYNVLRALLSEQMTLFVQVVFLQMFVLNVVYLIHIEDTYRREFKSAHEHILMKAFLGQCLEVCQRDIRRPLEQLVLRQDELLKVVIYSALTKKVQLDRPLLHHLEPLHVSHALFTEIMRELSYVRTLPQLTTSTVTRSNATGHRSILHAVLLTRAVAEIISSFSSSAENHHVKIYAEVDVSLAVVLVDWPMLSTLLTNLLNTALRNIREFCIEQPRNLDLTNYVLLKITAVEEAEQWPAGAAAERVSYRMVAAKKTLLVNVCDSSNAALKEVRAAEARREEERRPDFYRTSQASRHVGETLGRDPYGSKYGRSVCEKMVHSVAGNPVFQTITVPAQLSTVQRFTFPYQIAPETRRAKEYAEAETDRPFLTVSVCVTDYLTVYQRILHVIPHKKVAQGGKRVNNKELVLFSGAAAAQRSEVARLTQLFDAAGWTCTAKYILSLPSMHSVAGADCVLIDQQLEVLENVSISAIVLKLRTCGFNGVVAVLLQEDLKYFHSIREELECSVAKTDLVLLAPIQDAHIVQLTAALKRRCVRQVVYMNGN